MMTKKTVYHAQRATTGAADRSLINGRRQREEEMDGEGKAERNRERKERKADRLRSPPPLCNQGGEDTEGRWRRRRRERRTYASSSAARQPDHYITQVFKLT